MRICHSPCRHQTPPSPAMVAVLLSSRMDLPRHRCIFSMRGHISTMTLCRHPSHLVIKVHQGLQFTSVPACGVQHRTSDDTMSTCLLLPTCLILIIPLYQSASQPDTSIKYYKFKMIEVKVSSHLLITSGISQCPIIGTFLFVLYINDVCDVCTSFLKLYANRAIIYQKIKSIQYVLSLQKDLLLLWSQI